MQVVYCHGCGAVSMRTRGEPARCARCGGRAEPMEYGRPWQYYVSSAFLLIAAAFFVIGPIQDLATRLLIFVVVLAGAFALSSWGLRGIRSKVFKDVARRKSAEEKA